MVTRLSQTDRQKFVAILSRLDSNFPGEVVAAARAAKRFLNTHNATWADCVPGTPANDTDKPRRPTVLDEWPLRWRAAVATCDQGRRLLSSWERAFCAELARYRHRPSAAQLDILATITARVMAAEVAS
jgi:hypothetical protein